MDGHSDGSSLIGQNSRGGQWFQSCPSAVDYNADGSASSNLGPNSPDLLKSITQRKAQVAELNGVPESAVRPDAATASASGLDPGISPAYAAIQVNRVAKENGLTVRTVRLLVAANTHGRPLGFLGEPYVDVLELNMAVPRQPAEHASMTERPSEPSASPRAGDNRGVRKGRLRIYLGAAPGVGKTYAMLNEGHRRHDRGTDVVIGYVETHDRPVTAAQIGDLEVVPRRASCTAARLARRWTSTLS